MSQDEITYLVETRDAFFKMTLPARYRLTLGPLAPGSKGVSTNVDNPVLRVYDGTKQRGVFHNVVTFRDIQIQIIPGTMDKDGNVTWLSPMAMIESLPISMEPKF